MWDWGEGRGNDVGLGRGAGCCKHIKNSGEGGVRLRVSSVPVASFCLIVFFSH